MDSGPVEIEASELHANPGGARLARAVEGLAGPAFRADQSKNDYIHVRVTAAQRRELRAAADRLGITVSALLLGLFEHAKERL